MLAHYSHCLYLVLFATGDGRRERQDCEKKDYKGDRVGVFQWLARLTRLARMARMPRTQRTFWAHNTQAIMKSADYTAVYTKAI